MESPYRIKLIISESSESLYKEISTSKCNSSLPLEPAKVLRGHSAEKAPPVWWTVKETINSDGEK